MKIRINIKSALVYLLGIYFFLCPIEFALQRLMGISVIKYLGVVIILLSLYMARKETLKVEKTFICYTAWLFVGILSSVFSSNSTKLGVYLSSYINIVFFLIVVINVRYSVKQSFFLLNCYYLGSALVVLLMIVKPPAMYHGAGFRSTLSLFGAEIDPNNLAAFCVPASAIGVFFFFKEKGLRRLLHLAISVIGLIATFYTGSRGGFVTFIVCVSLVIMDALKRDKLKKKVFIIVIVILLTCLVGYLLEKYIAPELLNRILSIESYEGGSGRNYIWERAIQDINDHLFLGQGIGSHVSKYAKPIHNSFLTVMYETGIVGTVLFLFPLIFLIKKLFKLQQFTYDAVVLSGVIPSIFIDALNKRFLWNGIILAIILLRNNYKEKN